MTPTHQAFQGETARKAHFIDRVMAHQAAKEVVPGPGFWDGSRGSLVGVTVHSSDAEQFEAETGIAQGTLLAAERIWRLCMFRLGLHHVPWDIFDKSTIERLRAFPATWLQAIQPGADTGQVARLVMVSCLQRVLQQAEPHADLRKLCALLRELIGAHEQHEAPPAAAWRGWRKAAQALVASHRESTLQAALAEIAATAAWPCTASGGAVPDVIEQVVELAHFDARRELGWTAVEEEAKRVLDAERNAVVMDLANREAGLIAAYDNALKTGFPAWLARDWALKECTGRRTLDRIVDIESLFIGLLTHTPTAIQE